MSSPYIVLARFIARPERLDELLTLLRAHAAASMAEVGCRVFDVNQDTQNPIIIVLYEIYDDTTAYALHRDTPHYARFREAIGTLVEPGPDGMIFQERRVLRSVPLTGATR